MSEPTAGITFSMPVPPTIESVVTAHLAGRVVGNPEALVKALVDREEYVADVLRIAGQSFGLLPQIVAEVFASIGFGAPVPEEQRALIHQQFHRTIEIIQAGGDPFAPPDNNN